MAFVFIVLFYFCDCYRYRTLLRKLGVHLSYRDLYVISILNFFFAWTTPGAILSGPMTSFYFYNKGCSVEKSLIASFGKSIFGQIVLSILAFIFFYTSKMRDQIPSSVQNIIFGTLIFYIFLFLGLVLSRAFYWKFEWRVPNVFRKMHDQLDCFYQGIELRDLVEIVCSQLLFFLFIFIALVFLTAPYFPLLEIFDLLSIGSLFLFLIYISPSPGGVGLCELVGIPILSKMIGMDSAIKLTVMIRGFLVYIPIFIGAFVYIYTLIPIKVDLNESHIK